MFCPAKYYSDLQMQNIWFFLMKMCNQIKIFLICCSLQKYWYPWGLSHLVMLPKAVMHSVKCNVTGQHKVVHYWMLNIFLQILSCILFIIHNLKTFFFFDTLWWKYHQLSNNLTSSNEAHSSATINCWRLLVSSSNLFLLKSSQKKAITKLNVIIRSPSVRFGPAIRN